MSRQRISHLCDLAFATTSAFPDPSARRELNELHAQWEAEFHKRHARERALLHQTTLQNADLKNKVIQLVNARDSWRQTCMLMLWAGGIALCTLVGWIFF